LISFSVSNWYAAAPRLFVRWLNSGVFESN
jgi:hypothetical protein